VEYAIEIPRARRGEEKTPNENIKAVDRGKRQNEKLKGGLRPETH